MLDELKAIIQGNQKALIVMLVFIALDVITGVINAVIKQELNSTKLKEGLYHKLLELMLVIAGISLDFLLDANYITYAILIAFVAMEGISICENVGEYVPIPSVLKEVLEKLNAGEK